LGSAILLLFSLVYLLGLGKSEFDASLIGLPTPIARVPALLEKALSKYMEIFAFF